MSKYTTYGNSYLTTIVKEDLILQLDSGDSTSDDGVAYKWNDISGNGHLFDLVNTPTYSATFGGVRTYNGVDNRAVGNPDNFVIDLTKKFTITVIAYPDSTSPIRTALATFKTSAGTSFTMFLFNNVSDRRLSVTSNGNNIVNSRTNQFFVPDRCNEFTLRYNGLGITNVNNFKLTVNLVENTVISANNLGNGTNKTVIGSVPQTASYFYNFKGFIPIVNVWDEELTNSQLILNNSVNKTKYNLP